MRRILPLFAATLLLPTAASAQVLSQVAGLFNIMVGLMLVAAFLLFFGGLVLWVVRLGTWPTYRDEAINYMKWGVVVLFVLALLLFLVQFVQQHAAVASFLVGIVIVCIAGWVVYTVATTKPEKEEE